MMSSACHSLLLETPPPHDLYAPAPHEDAFADLHLDDIITAATQSHPEYDLADVYHRPLRSLDAIAYRHDIFRDLEKEPTRRSLAAFTEGMREVRRRAELRDHLQLRAEADLCHLSAVRRYGELLEALHGDLRENPPRSRGLRTMCDDLTAYLESAELSAACRQANQLQQAVDDLRYVVLSQGGKLTVGPFDDEPDYTAEVLDTFSRFRHVRHEHSAPARRQKLEPLGRVEGIVLGLVAQVFPKVFEELSTFCARTHAFITDQVTQYEHDAEFYLSYLELTDRLGRRDIHFTLPHLSRTDRTEKVTGMIDVALADRRAITPVTNDYRIDSGEQMLAISGPNQGGKTTTARAIGQLHYLAAVGVPVAATQATLFLPDRVFTHFERAESIVTLAGKLEDELIRIRGILDDATGDSVVILNETFGSTSLEDGRLLGAAVIRRILRLGALSVYVTFIDELTALDPAIVSMKSLVDPDDVTVRTFKVQRHPADGRAYAMALARKYHLDHDSIRAKVTA